MPGSISQQQQQCMLCSMDFERPSTTGVGVNTTAVAVQALTVIPLAGIVHGLDGPRSG